MPDERTQCEKYRHYCTNCDNSFQHHETILKAIAAYFEGGGSRYANLHESAGSWAASEIRRILKGETSLETIINDEERAIAAKEGWQ